jgi:hypothetical protein
MSKPLEDKDSPALKARLQSLGFDQIEFEPKTNNRFIVKIEDFPSHVIKAVKLPSFFPTTTEKWAHGLELTFYNPIDARLEQQVLDLVARPQLLIRVNILSPVATIDTIWNIHVSNGSATFEGYDWSDKGATNFITAIFKVENVYITYPGY